ncbi:MAG: DUF3995 domain-containing protein [Myxococcota bacterium]|nr:DUF3995 domain-containing protein [Myxococcota bacterium]MEC9443290.1 DUF3995 domain-containing protein [Myxococcota bacterium]
MATYIAAGTIIFIAMLHSILGEIEILSPLFRAEWETALPRYAVERILRFAWHLTSIAWIALGVAALGGGALDALGACALASAAVIFVMLRGHLAWPLFLLCGSAALLAAGHLPSWVMHAVIYIAALTGLVIAGVHVYWTLGGMRGIEDALPHLDERELAARGGKPLPRPPKPMVALVAAALASFAGILLCAVWFPDARWPVWLLACGGVVFGLRSVGDGKYVGLTKTIRSTRFARLDDRYYTPISVLLTMGCVSAWLI